MVCELIQVKLKNLLLDPEAINTTLPHLKPTQELSSVSTTSNCWEYMSTQLCLGQNIAKKATKRLYFLKVLKRAGLPPHDLLHYYVAVIRPVLEYCSCIWHHNITNKLSLQIEAIQKRAITSSSAVAERPRCRVGW